MEEGYATARAVALTMLATIKAHCGDLDRVKRVLRLFGMVNCTPDFVQMPQVIDGASDLFFELWGAPHARTAIGQTSLPRGIAVEVNGEFELHTD
jgi:enamine deaminase RidA (YjgF/YER057c/UK114 family)